MVSKVYILILMFSFFGMMFYNIYSILLYFLLKILLIGPLPDLRQFLTTESPLMKVAFYFTLIFIFTLTSYLNLCPDFLGHVGKLLDMKAKTTIPDKIFETNSSFCVKQHTTGKVQFPFSISFELVLTKFSFGKKEQALGYIIL